MYLSKSASSNNLEGLKVVQAKSRPLQPQKLGLLTGVLRAAHYFLQNTSRQDSQTSEDVKEKDEKGNKTFFCNMLKSLKEKTERTVPPHLANPLHPWPSPASSAYEDKKKKKNIQ